MFGADDFSVFDRYTTAGQHAFSTGEVVDRDKDFYQAIYLALRHAAERAIEPAPLSDWFETWSVRFGRDGGVQGHRPIDLWASVINRPPDAFPRFPQVYLIASSAGLEIGFSAAIHEDDYYNVTIKQKSRDIIPLLYRKLPAPSDGLTVSLDDVLAADSSWQFAVKSREQVFQKFSSSASLFQYLRSPENAPYGGGSIYKIVPRSELARLDLDVVFADALAKILATDATTHSFVRRETKN